MFSNLPWPLASALDLLAPLALFAVPLALGLAMALTHRLILRIRIAIVRQAITALRSKGEL